MASFNLIPFSYKIAVCVVSCPSGARGPGTRAGIPTLSPPSRTYEKEIQLKLSGNEVYYTA